MALKANLYVEFQGKQVESKELLAAAKKVWVEGGNKVKDLNTLDLYIKPEENAATTYSTNPNPEKSNYNFST